MDRKQKGNKLYWEEGNNQEIIRKQETKSTAAFPFPFSFEEQQ